MCRNIKTLFNFEPPATDDEIHASALQFVRKLSGFNKPSQANEAAFDRAVRGSLHPVLTHSTTSNSLSSPSWVNEKAGITTRFGVANQAELIAALLEAFALN